MVPEHRILSSEEAEKVLKKLKTKREHLPKISLEDPIAQEIEAQIGDVIEVKRKSSTAGYTIVYRHAIEM